MDPTIHPCLVKRLELLRKGEHTDCVFQVGPDEQTQEFHACKFDLVASSEYFEGLLRSPLTPPGPIRIKHVQPKIFEMILRCVHCTGKIEVNSLEECIQLASAADEFLMSDVGQYCADMLLEEFLTVENVWKTLSDNYRVNFVASACEKVLSSNVEACLLHPTFLEIEEQALSKFLAFEGLTVESEMVLVRACIQFAKARYEERVVFRRVALPHLRLLTLKADDLAEVTPYLTLEEKLYLVHNLNQKDPLLAHEELPDSTSLCKIKEPRNPALLAKRILTLFPRDQILDLEELVREGKYTNLKTSQNQFTLSFTVDKCIEISAIEIFCPVNMESNFFMSGLLDSLQKQQEEKKTVSMSLFDATVTVDYKDYSKNDKLETKKEFTYNSWVCYNKCIWVPKGAKVTFQVIVLGTWFVREILVNQTDFMDLNENALAKDIFKNFVFEQHHKAPSSSSFTKIEGKEALGIVKCLRYKLV